MGSHGRHPKGKISAAIKNSEESLGICGQPAWARMTDLVYLRRNNLSKLNAGIHGKEPWHGVVVNRILTGNKQLPRIHSGLEVRCS